MRILGFFAIAVGVLVAVGCSAPAPGGDLAADDPVPEPTTKSKAKPKPTPPAPTPTPTPDPIPPPAPIPDAGAVDSAPPTSGYCQQLGPCCAALQDPLEHLICQAIQQSGQEVACQVKHELCKLMGKP